MVKEQDFIEDDLRRAQIDEFFQEELDRAGYGGMDIVKTPMGTQIVLKAEKPGMVIGKGGKNIREITTKLTEEFGMDDPQVDVQEVEEPDLNARIVADRLANALERGWYFRKAGHTTIDRIMEAGALGAEIVLSGRVSGARTRVEKFNRGYFKHTGEPDEEDAVPAGDDDDVEVPDEDPAEAIDEEIVEEVIDEETDEESAADDDDDADDADGDSVADEDLNEDVAEEAADLVEEMEDGDERADAGELFEDESNEDQSDTSIKKTDYDYSNESNHGVHQEWLLKEPDEREEHPIDRIREIHKIDPGDECPLENCMHEWGLHKISIENGNKNESSLEKTFCSDPTCPLSLRTPSRLSEYLKGEMEREGNQMF